MNKGVEIWNKIRRSINDDPFMLFLETYPSNTFFICGGCIRNIILHDEDNIKDIDLFVNLSHSDFDVFVRNLRDWGEIEYGQYGSPRFLRKGWSFDIVPFFNFIVSKNPILSINDLLANFDITVNSLALDVTTKQLYNPQKGLEDMERKILRAVRLDFPEKNISDEIPLSAVSVFWFRLLHYQKKLGFSFCSSTLAWIIANKFRYKDLDLFKKFFFVPLIDKSLLENMLSNE